MKRGSRLNHFLDFYAGISLLSLIAVVRRKKRFPEALKRVGIFVNPALGDTLLCSGPILDLHQAFPDAKLLLFATTSNDLAARLLPGVDEVQSISITNPWQAIRQFRQSELDLLVDFTSWQRITAVITACSGAKFVVGYKSLHQYRHYCYDKTVDHRSDRHELENHRALASSVGGTARNIPRIKLEPILPTALPDGVKETIVLHPWPSGSGSWLREWPQERWVELAKSLAKPGRQFLISGSPGDRPRSEALCQLLRQRGVQTEVFVGANGLVALANLLAHANLLISVNTGIMHLGWIIGTPTVCINGPTDQRRWGPLGTHTIGVDTPDGSGGFLHLGFEFKGKPTDTMQRISTQQVLEAALKLLP